MVKVLRDFSNAKTANVKEKHIKILSDQEP